ncbi:hypothetical protein, variant [Exophiala mesophila]|nr:hypothetical protein, variant [Exophiala mesophila]KIV88957.1 hypothetical protein, variant [Exophiala mesophila]
MSASTSTAVPVFSYAQAAKGLAPASSQAASRNEVPTSDKAGKDKPTQAVASVPTPKSSQPALGGDGKSTTVDSATASSTPDILASSEVGQKTTENSQQESQQTPQNDTLAKVNGVSPNAASAQDVQSNTRPALTNGRADSSDRSPTVATRDDSSQSTSDKKTKDTDDDWEKVSNPSIAPEKELKAAPIPTVNIWKQRQEAQAAKKKEVTATPATLPSSQQKPKPEENKRRPSTKDQPTIDREGRNGEVGRPGVRKDNTSTRSPRSISRQGETQTESEAPPTVGDSQSWPTPESSMPDERRKSSSYEKVDKPDPKFNVQKSHGKSWVSVPFVPSAKFETQLPPAAARRGGRGSARGARDAGARGATGNVTEKQETSGLMGPPPIPRPSGEQDRGRRSEGQSGARGASVPTSSTANRQPNGDESLATIGQRSLAMDKEFIPSENATTSNSSHIRDQSAKTTMSSRSSSGHTGHAGHRASDGNTNLNDQAMGYSHVSEQGTRQSSSGDRFKGVGATSGPPRGNGDFARDRTAVRNREWSRDKPENAREKVESWRDRENSNDQGSRRDTRTERGGRNGPFRGARGGHSFGSTYGSHTSPLPQNGFEPARSTSQSGTRSRQSSQPFVPTQTATNPRQNPRSQSIPVQMVYPQYYQTGHNVAHGLPPLQTDGYGYPQMPLQPGIMSAMPYNEPLNQLALMSMVVTQIEYYFSIDNLCKDVFLRKHMDGQGWVPLSVITNFKRIKTLTEENMAIETLRFICQTVRSVDFLPGIDGDDRLRSRDNWRDFVLPPEERFESARHDGPVHAPQQYMQIYPGAHNSFEGGLDAEQAQSPPPIGGGVPNGVFSHGSPPTFTPGLPIDLHSTNGTFIPPIEDSLAADMRHPSTQTVPPHIPATLRSPPLQGSPSQVAHINGHRRQSSRSDIEANVFPDESIPNINIRMQQRTASTKAETVARSSQVQVAAQDSNGVAQEASDPSTQQGAPSLRGGAGSLEQ